MLKIWRERKGLLILVLVLFVVIFAVGIKLLFFSTTEVKNSCALGSDDITYVTATGKVMDNSFNESSWNGIQNFCRSYNYGVGYVQTLDSKDLIENVQLASSNSPLVVINAPLKNKELYTVIKDNPDTKYLILWGEVIDPATNEVALLDNVKSYNFNEEQASFMAGYMAAKVSITRHVGFIAGGLDDEISRNYFAGFAQGLQTTGRKIKIDIKLLAGYNDIEGAREAASQMYDNGCDIIFHAAGESGIGVIEEGKIRQQSGEQVWVIGADTNQYELGQYGNYRDNTSSVLTSAVIYNDRAVYDGLSAYFSGAWKGNNYYQGMDTNSVGITNTYPRDYNSVADEAKFNLIMSNEIQSDVVGKLDTLTNLTITKY